jgi:predicted transglutaminase-like cysteine proteinase
MLQLKKGVLFAGLVAAGGLIFQAEPTTAALLGFSKSLSNRTQQQNPIERLQLSQPALPPFGHTLFCLRYPEECEVKRMAMRRDLVVLNDKRSIQLTAVNLNVNQAIIPRHKSSNVIEANWIVSPTRGDCNDYAITKRHELVALGWPTSALLLAEVVTAWGEHHLILVVRTSDGDYVLDNLAPRVRAWSETSYRWIRMQSPQNPKLWWTVRATIV